MRLEILGVPGSHQKDCARVQAKYIFFKFSFLHLKFEVFFSGFFLFL